MSTSIDQQAWGASTTCVHAGVSPDPVHGAIMTPIFQTSTYVQPAPGQPLTHDYARSGNPTRDALEESLAALEGARHAISFGSGLAAVQAVIQLAKPGDRVVVCDDVYGGTGRLFRQIYAAYGILFEYVDLTVEPKKLREVIKPDTRFVWIESPTNPLLKVIDIRDVAEVAHEIGACLIVDNTFASPIFQSPLKLGADIVMHSLTKYIGGHSDIIGGALMLNDSTLAERLRFIQFAAGAVNAPLDAFLLLRSIKTLAVRMEVHQRNAFAVAEALCEMPEFSEVIYPGLTSHPRHETARAQMSGFSGMVSVRLNGDLERATRFMQALRVFSLAESLGGVESLVNHPQTMTHASVPASIRAELRITSDLIRLSVGIEDASDLIADLRQAARQALA